MTRRAFTVEQAVEQLQAAPADTPVVAYCSVGYRSWY